MRITHDQSTSTCYDHKKVNDGKISDERQEKVVRPKLRRTRTQPTILWKPLSKEDIEVKKQKMAHLEKLLPKTKTQPALFWKTATKQTSC